MPQVQRGPRDRRKVPIPTELRDSLREVWEMVRQAKNDPDLNWNYGDAIQVGAVCGGRIGDKSRPYVLTYYPEGDKKRGRWFLTLHGTEIEDIADGRMTEITMYCCTLEGCRCKFREAEGFCDHCDKASNPDYARLSIEEALPRLEAIGIRGLSATSTQQDVITLLGQPNKSGGGLDSVIGFIRPWVKYHLPERQVRFEFGDQGQIVGVTLLPKDWQPGGRGSKG
jgi:hypothetical protein